MFLEADNHVVIVSNHDSFEPNIRTVDAGEHLSAEVWTKDELPVVLATSAGRTCLLKFDHPDALKRWVVYRRNNFREAYQIDFQGKATPISDGSPRRRQSTDT